jgi:polyisoprenyl-phosphate glycosyltransferase
MLLGTREPRKNDGESELGKEGLASELRTQASGRADSGVRPLLSVVVPCFNEHEVIHELHDRLTRVCAAVASTQYEIVLVDDGSTDSTWTDIAALAERDHHIVGVSLSRNHGHQLALTAGLSVCRGERILIIDADLQDPPEILPEMMAHMDEGADVVYGTRIRRSGETLFKRATASAFYRLLSSIAEVEIPRNTGDFRLISRRVADLLNAMPERHRFIRGMVAWIGLRQVALHYERAERHAGQSKYPLRRMLRFAADAITAFSYLPLSASIYFGLFSVLAAGMAFSYTIYSWLFLDAVSGWASLMAVVLLFASLQLFFLGIIGEYVGRLHLQTSNRPLFIIDKIMSTPAVQPVRGGTAFSVGGPR